MRNNIYLTHYRTAATSHTEVIEDNSYPQRVHMFADSYDDAKRGFTYVPHSLADKVIDDDIVAHIEDNPVKGKTGFILAAGSQGWAGVSGKKINEDSRLAYTYKMPLLCLTNIFGGSIASKRFGIKDYTSTDASACASSLKVMMEVQNLMTNFGFDRFVVLAMEDAVNNSTLEFFGQAKASLLLKDEGSIKPSAFDSVNAGFNLGQGVALCVFETESALTTTPEARFLGAYTSAEDFSNPLGQRPDGEGYRRAMEGAMHYANVKPEEVKIIKTHGTGTVTNNISEKAAITGLFDDFVATSYKTRYGHTLAASGLMETGLLLNDIKQGFIPGILNRTEDDNKFLSKDSQVPDGLIMSLASGMGNVYSAALFGRVQ